MSPGPPQYVFRHCANLIRRWSSLDFICAIYRHLFKTFAFFSQALLNFSSLPFFVFPIYPPPLYCSRLPIGQLYNMRQPRGTASAYPQLAYR